jgi:hypothetical protein
MEIFNRLFNKSGGRFVTEKQFQKNKAKQITMSPKTLKQLEQYGVNETTKLKLEYFFYTDCEDKAKALLHELKLLNYEVEFGPSAGNPKQFLITGWTTKLPMTNDSLNEWTEWMCDLGFKHDCDFDGWGTTPEQDE